MKYRCLIAEDNLMERDTLEMLLQKMENIELIAVCSNGMEAAAILSTEQIDIVFSDIDMPQMSGINLLLSLANPPVFIFVSAHKEYAAESYDLDVVDFMVKPVMSLRLTRAVNKAIEHIENKKKMLAENIRERETQVSGTFIIRTSEGLVKLPVGEINYIKSIGNFSKLFLRDGKFHITLVSLKNLEVQLPAKKFFRIHKQHIVNIHNITVVDNASVTLHGNHEIPMSPLYSAALLQSFTSGDTIVRRLPAEKTDKK